MYLPTMHLAKRFGEIFFKEEKIVYFDIESNNHLNSISIVIEGTNTKVYFYFVQKDSYPETCNDLLIKNDFMETLLCKLNDYSKDLYFNISLYENIGIEHEKLQEAIDEISKLDTPEYYHDLLIRINC